MTTQVTEGELAGMRWLGVRGDRHAAFRALGDAARDDIAAGLHSVLEGDGVRRRVEDAPELVHRVRKATRARHPTQIAEAVALAEGAGADIDALLVANLRGDIGTPGSAGCSDLAWHRERSYIAHNEDGPSDINLTILSLAIDDEPAITVEWYPGFLPANSFVVTDQNLVWGIDHIPVDQPYRGPGRHFVARTLQQCTSLDEAVTYLTSNPSAGGFAYNLGELDTGRVATVEVAAGNAATMYTDPQDEPLLWHTNHVRYVDAEHTLTRENSIDRAWVLDALLPPEEEPDPAWFLDVLARDQDDGGVRQPRSEHGMTLCTTVADLGDRVVTLRAADGTVAALDVDALLAGPS
ncbi:MAG: hypothetical protein GEV07_28735 [Streptosporangiales bacterium]|nr:hypothetical protein [Streptosporangiales bacterium]